MARFPPRTALLLIGLLGALLAPVTGLAGSAYTQVPMVFLPRQPLRIMVPFAAGGAPDTVARLLAQYSSNGLGRVFVENITGGAGNIAMCRADARAASDGYTVLMCTLGCAFRTCFCSTTSRSIRATDIAPVMLAGVYFLTSSWPQHDQLGQTFHRACTREAWQSLDGLFRNRFRLLISPVRCSRPSARSENVHVPYRGSTAAYQDIVAGRVKSMIVSLPEALQLIKSGQLRALGVSAADHSIACRCASNQEAGVPGYAVVAWSAMFVPKGIPAGPSFSRFNARVQ